MRTRFGVLQARLVSPPRYHFRRPESLRFRALSFSGVGNDEEQPPEQSSARRARIYWRIRLRPRRASPSAMAASIRAGRNPRTSGPALRTDSASGRAWLAPSFFRLCSLDIFFLGFGHLFLPLRPYRQAPVGRIAEPMGSCRAEARRHLDGHQPVPHHRWLSRVRTPKTIRQGFVILWRRYHGISTPS